MKLPLISLLVLCSAFLDIFVSCASNPFDSSSGSDSEPENVAGAVEQDEPPSRRQRLDGAPVSSATTDGNGLTVNSNQNVHQPISINGLFPQSQTSDGFMSAYSGHPFPQINSLRNIMSGGLESPQETSLISDSAVSINDPIILPTRDSGEYSQNSFTGFPLTQPSQSGDSGHNPIPLIFRNIPARRIINNISSSLLNSSSSESQPIILSPSLASQFGLNGFINLPRKRSVLVTEDSPEVNQEPIIFDNNDTVLLEIISKAAVHSTHSIGYFSEFVDPEDGSRRFVSLPLVINPANEIDEQEIEGESDQEEESKDDVEEDDDYDSDETTDEPTAIRPAIMQTPPRQSSTSGLLGSQPTGVALDYLTPTTTNRPQPVCPPPPVANYFDCDEDDASTCSSIKLGQRSCIPDQCAEAERVFARDVAVLTREAERHIAFPDQEVLFEVIGQFDSCGRLNTDHLRAFEFEFGIFYKLVANCPQKYLLPALALALQYDEDFPKFLRLYFSLRDSYQPGKLELNLLQEILIEIILNMRTISYATFEFFANSRNAAFVFSDFSTYPCFYGKFSPHLIAHAISKQRALALIAEYENNPLRSFILNFDYPSVIDSCASHTKFSRVHFKEIFHLGNLFNSKKDHDFAIYKLFKFASDDLIVYLSSLMYYNMVESILKEALKQGDFAIVRTLFFNFTLENKGRVSFRMSDFGRYCNRLGNFEIKRINEKFCMIKLKYADRSRLDVTLIMPLE